LSAELLFDKPGSRVYKPDNFLNFKNGKLVLFEHYTPHDKAARNHKRLLIGANMFLSTMTIRSVMKARPIRSVLWGVPTCVLSLVINMNRDGF